MSSQSVGNLRKEDNTPNHSPPPTTEQVPAPLRRTPVTTGKPTQELLRPDPGFMFIPLDRPLPWEEAFACVRHAIENRHPLNVVNFSELISACTLAGRVDEALDAFAMMEDLKIAPNDCTFDILISACENHRRFERSDELLDDAVQRGIYQKSLGYDRKANEMDFHHQKILTGEPGGGGVSVPFARALFRRHCAREVDFGPGTLFIVGRHGYNLIKEAIVKCIEAEQGEARHQEKEYGYVNYGAMHWITPGQQPAQPDVAPAATASAPPRLNPEAPEFVPPGALSSRPVSWNLDAREFVPSQYSLNPDAQVFVPSRGSLNPNAKEFVPGQKPQ